MCFDDNLFEPVLVQYTAKSSDEDVTKSFKKSLENSITNIYKKFKFKKNLIWTKKDKRSYKKATHCHICEGKLFDDRVADHCHLSGKSQMQSRISDPKVFSGSFS